MPGRGIILATENIYHVLNRGIASQPVFLDKRDYKRALEAMLFYQNIRPPLKYSMFLLQSRERREVILKNLRQRRNFWVEILAFCFMPNHFHILVRQSTNSGTSRFLSNFTNSYTRYFNTRHKRKGPLFQGKFKAVRIETDEQLLHVSRYIHLNPYSSYLVGNFDQLIDYPFSSLSEYLKENETDRCQEEQVLVGFKSREDYRRFMFDRADYQRHLEEIKHLITEV